MSAEDNETVERLSKVARMVTRAFYDDWCVVAMDGLLVCASNPKQTQICEDDFAKGLKLPLEKVRQALVELENNNIVSSKERSTERVVRTRDREGQVKVTEIKRFWYVDFKLMLDSVKLLFRLMEGEMQKQDKHETHKETRYVCVNPGCENKGTEYSEFDIIELHSTTGRTNCEECDEELEALSAHDAGEDGAEARETNDRFTRLKQLLESLWKDIKEVPPPPKYQNPQRTEPGAAVPADAAAHSGNGPGGGGSDGTHIGVVSATTSGEHSTARATGDAETAREDEAHAHILGNYGKERIIEVQPPDTMAIDPDLNDGTARSRTEHFVFRMMVQRTIARTMAKATRTRAKVTGRNTSRSSASVNCSARLTRLIGGACLRKSMRLIVSTRIPCLQVTREPCQGIIF
jgi:transcription initiation factor IIE alpha subunit